MEKLSIWYLCTIGTNDAGTRAKGEGDIFVGKTLLGRQTTSAREMDQFWLSRNKQNDKMNLNFRARMIRQSAEVDYDRQKIQVNH